LAPHLSGGFGEEINLLSLGRFGSQTERAKLDGYTVHQQCWTLLLPTDVHNVKKHRVIKTFQNIIRIFYKLCVF